MSQHQVVEAHFLGPRFLAVLPFNIEGGGGTVEIQPTGTFCTMSPGSRRRSAADRSSRGRQ
jgi:hypothetical protein